jgi:hypothetical protein
MWGMISHRMLNSRVRLRLDGRLDAETAEKESAIVGSLRVVMPFREEVYADTERTRD